MPIYLHFPKMQGLFTTMMIWKSGHIDSLFLLTSCFANKMTFISAKLPFGPVPQKFDTIILQMIDKGQLQRVKTEYHGYPQTRYLPLVKADLTEMKASEKEVIDNVIQQMSDWSAAAISNYSHNDLPWEVTDEGKEISYELAFYREMPYSVRVYDETND